MIRLTTTSHKRLIAAVAAVLFSSAVLVSEGQTNAGTIYNGTAVNGTTFNGTTIQGTAYNGAWLQGDSWNGDAFNGEAWNGWHNGDTFNGRFWNGSGQGTDNSSVFNLSGVTLEGVKLIETSVSH